MIFGCSSYLAGHLYGHFNLIHAWTIPLFALAALRAMRSGMVWSVVAGLVLGVTFYIDYYYLVYECGLAALIAATTNRDWSIAWTGPGSVGRMRVARVVMALAGTRRPAHRRHRRDGRIYDRHGWPADFGARPVQPTAGVLASRRLLGLAEIRPTDSFDTNQRTEATGAKLAVMALTLSVAAAPLILSAIGLFRSGDYVTQTYFWRNAPSGIDLAALVAGPPFHGLAGPLRPRPLRCP